MLQVISNLVIHMGEFRRGIWHRSFTDCAGPLLGKRGQLLLPSSRPFLTQIKILGSHVQLSF